MMIYREKRPHQRCLVNVFMRLVVSIAYTKIISLLLDKHNDWKSSVAVFDTSGAISSSAML